MEATYLVINAMNSKVAGVCHSISSAKARRTTLMKTEGKHRIVKVIAVEQVAV